MSVLEEFPGQGGFSIPQRISTKYPTFGTALLVDKDGGRVAAIKEEMKEKPTDINREILRLWVSGEGRKPCTWVVLIQVLRSPCQLNALADDIERQLSK